MKQNALIYTSKMEGANVEGAGKEEHTFHYSYIFLIYRAPFEMTTEYSHIGENNFYAEGSKMLKTRMQISLLCQIKIFGHI